MGLPLDLPSLLAATAAGQSFTYRMFWGHRARGDGGLSDACFSQWWPSRFTVGDQAYSSAEQFMMASKARMFRDDSVLAEILATAEPRQVKALGRKVQNFDETTWARSRFDLVTAGNLAKFGQDPALRAYLIATGGELPVEASPEDRVWGIGLAAQDARAADPRQWLGLNLLGFAIARARAILSGELPAPQLP